MAGFGFDKSVVGPAVDDGIGLGPLSIAIEEHAAAFASVGPTLDNFRNHPGLEDGAAQRVVAQLIDCADAEQPARESGIMEVELGHFDQAPAQVGMEGGQAKHDESRFEDGQPCFCGRLGDSRVGRQCGEIEQLGGPTGTQFHESLKSGQVGDPGHGPHIAFDVGGDIGAQPVGGGKPLIEDARVSPRQHGIVQVLRMGVEATDFRPR